MNRTIAVEHSLTPVMDLLSEKGYKVEDIDISSEYRKNINRYDAVVITGINRDFLGVEDIVSKIPVIDADGLTAEQICHQVINSLKQ